MNATPAQKRPDLLDVREMRAATPFEFREAGDTLTLVGYASTFQSYEMYGGPAAGGWIEQIGRNAFDKTLRGKPDLHLLINHEGLPLARTGSGTLELSVDDHGLKVRAELDRSDPDVQRLEPKMRRGDMNEMSFAFRVKAQTWSAATGYDDPNSCRTITEISLHKGDVSIVNWGANPTTTAEVLGRRRKGKDGARKTLTQAEAAAVMLADAKRASRSNGGTGKPRITRAEADQQMAFDESVRRAHSAIGYSVVARAAELLGVDVDTPTSAAARAWQILRRQPEPGDRWSILSAPPGTPSAERRELYLLQAQHRVRQDQLRKAHYEELARQRRAFPPVPGLVDGRVTPKSIGIVDPERITPADLGIVGTIPVHQRAAVEELCRRAEAERELARQRDRRDVVGYLNPNYRPWN